MRKLWNTLIVLVISILMLLSSITLVVGTTQPDDIVDILDIDDLENMADEQFNGYAPFDYQPPAPTGTTIYHTLDEYEAEMQQIAIDHPSITKLISIGQTIEGREQWAMKISDNPELEEADEPELMFNGAHHCREWMTIEICIYAMGIQCPIHIVTIE